MPQASLRIRVDRLERRVDELMEMRDTVERMALQFSQSQDEMRVAISALDEKIRAGDEETRRVLREEIHAGDEETRRVLREEIRAGDEETRRVLREEIRAGDEETRRVLTGEIRSGDEETRRFMRVLYEDLVERIRTLREGGPLT